MAISEDTPTLPPFTIQFSYFFENVGLDYSGPLFYRNVVENMMQKCYILLFTCSVSRAIHLELTNNLGAEPPKLAIYKFISRRGTPSCFISNNFKTFKSMEIKRFIINLGIKWKFILEHSQWWGEFYERLVGLFKSCMKKVISKARLSFEDLETVIVEVKEVLNGRPLTYLSDEQYCSSLAPHHLMYGLSLFNSSKSKGVSSEISPSIDCQKIVQHHIVVTKHFKQRFINEDLIALQERHYYKIF